LSTRSHTARQRINGEAGKQSEGYRIFIENCPMKRQGDPELDIGPLAWFLCSDACRYLTGHTFMADGGAVHVGVSASGGETALRAQGYRFVTVVERSPTITTRKGISTTRRRCDSSTISASHTCAAKSAPTGSTSCSETNGGGRA